MSPRRRKQRKRSDPSDPSAQTDRSPYTSWLEHPDPAVVANTLICLIHQASYLLDRQITALERAIIEKGGYREQLTAARLAERGKGRRFSEPGQTRRTDPPAPHFFLAHLKKR